MLERNDDVRAVMVNEVIWLHWRYA